MLKKIENERMRGVGRDIQVDVLGLRLIRKIEVGKLNRNV